MAKMVAADGPADMVGLRLDVGRSAFTPPGVVGGRPARRHHPGSLVLRRMPAIILGALVLDVDPQVSTCSF